AIPPPEAFACHPAPSPGPLRPRPVGRPGRRGHAGSPSVPPGPALPSTVRSVGRLAGHEGGRTRQLVIDFLGELGNEVLVQEVKRIPDEVGPPEPEKLPAGLRREAVRPPVEDPGKGPDGQAAPDDLLPLDLQSPLEEVPQAV